MSCLKSHHQTLSHPGFLLYYLLGFFIVLYFTFRSGIQFEFIGYLLTLLKRKCCCCCCCCCVALVMSDSVWPHRWQPTRLPHPWDSPDKNPGVGCHFLLQCMKVKSESEVAQSCLTPSDPMDCSLPGSSVHGICQARVLEWVAIVLSISKSEQIKTQELLFKKPKYVSKFYCEK